MRHTTSLFLGALFLLPTASARAGDADNPERERISKTFNVASGSRIEVSTIAGPVEIDTTGGRRVEVEVVRSAPTRADLDCGRVDIEQTPTTLTIRSEANCNVVRGAQHVTLRVPRDVDLSLRNIAGDVRVGPTDGMVRLDSIAGRVEAAGLREAKISSLAGGLELTVSGVGARGITVSSVTGGIDLGINASVDAELVTRSVVGRIQNEVPGVRLTEDDGSNQRAVLGSGRGKIRIDSVVGTVRIHG